MENTKQANKLKEVFKSNKPIIGMLHLDYLSDSNKFQNNETLINKALKELQSLQEGGVDAILIENWKDESPSEFINKQAKESLDIVIKEIKKSAKIPLGINILPNDYITAFELAIKYKLEFVHLDVFVDKVLTDYSYSKVEPFTIKVDLEKVKAIKKQNNEIMLFTSIHPKHYKLLENKTIIQSAQQAIENLSDAIVVTGNLTGLKPDTSQLKELKQNITIPIIIGSGLTSINSKELLKYSDAAFVGTSIKDKNFENIIPEKTKELMKAVQEEFGK